ncbi:MAG: tRNA threonylcarbamoyladenosine dehydratase [Bacteroidales bacterium]|jgi:tRNA A37 threonylcarbamoyladenosine dehydratase|nr:tRNA threonylcarbamoyladenosine dehydratase [Bacteroidales bacterium]
MDWKDRTRLLLGEEKLTLLQQSHVLVVGLGGVGACVAEMLCRAGIGTLTLVDGDTVDTTNRNRQLPALLSTEGEYKTDVLKKRLLDINPDIRLNIICEFICDDRIAQIVSMDTYHYIVDAIDSISPKTFLLKEAVNQNIPVVSAMGAGGKTDPSKIQVADISKTYQCPLAACIRKRLKKLGVQKGIRAVFSTEKNKEDATRADALSKYKRTTCGTISYMPAMFGCWCASECINGILWER